MVVKNKSILLFTSLYFVVYFKAMLDKVLYTNLYKILIFNSNLYKKFLLHFTIFIAILMQMKNFIINLYYKDIIAITNI